MELSSQQLLDTDPESTAPRPFVFSLAPTIGGTNADHRIKAEPLRRYLERALRCPVQLFVAGNYGEIQGALRSGKAEAAMLGEMATRRAEEIGGIQPLVAPIGSNLDVPTYRSVIVTRIDSGIHDVQALRGATIGLVDRQSTSG
jgi:phosphonate transport system substrate-binding protein